jgi:endonuclease/exonuclease/phosphatase (EEP) superfamily protein YafD
VRFRFTNLVVLLGLPALLAGFAPWLARLHWTVDLAACFCPQALVANLLCALILFGSSRFRWALGYGAGFASAAIAVVVAGAASAYPASEPQLRVYTANLLFGNHGNAERWLQEVREFDPEVLFLSEVTPDWLTAIRSGLPGYQILAERTAEGSFGLALLARIPCRSAELLDGGFEWAPAVHATFDTALGQLQVVGVHPPRPGSSRHNRERDQALAHLTRTIAALPAPRVVLGDFNATPYTPGLRNLLATTQLRNAAGWSWQPTWTTSWPLPLRVPIDHVLVDKTIGVVEFRRGRDFGSDHLAVFASLGRAL